MAKKVKVVEIKDVVETTTSDVEVETTIIYPTTTEEVSTYIPDHWE